MTAKALLDKNPKPTDAQIREGMNGTLCRCMTYYRVQAAIKRAVKGVGRMTDAFSEIPKQVEDALTSRRSLLKSAGLLVVSFSHWRRGRERLRSAAGPYPDVDYRQVDSWIVDP